MQGSELRGIDTFIVSKLTADPQFAALVGTKVYTRPAPSGTAPPYVIATFLSSVDRNALGPGTRILSRALYLIRVITTDPNSSIADQVADRIDAALVGQFGTVVAQGVFLGMVVREEAIRYEEVTQSGVVSQHTGGRYRFWCTGIDP